MIFDHIGIFVKNLDEGLVRMQDLLPISSVSEVFHDPLLKVSVQFLRDSSGICYELIAPNGIGNPVDSMLDKRHNILNHMAYKVNDLDNRVEQLRQTRCIPLGNPQPAVAFRGARVVFLLTPLGTIVELIENLT
jgi:methylmalonyl-CoA/ethylmalonyl-CoA epimerase